MLISRASERRGARTRGIVGLALLVLAAPALRGAQPARPAKEPRSTAPRSLGASGEDFGPQFLGTDGKGKVFLLRAATLEVFALDAAKGLVPAARLKRSPALSAEPAHAAVMGRSSDDWWLLQGAGVWHTTSEGPQALPEVHWRVESLSRLGGGEPVVGVMPFGVGRPIGDRSFAAGDAAPLLLSFSGSAWRVLATEGEIPSSGAVNKEFARINQERMVALAPGATKGLWVADRYRFRVRKLSPAGKVLTSLKGSQEIRLENDKDGKATQRKLVQMGDKAGGAIANLAVPAILGLTEARDGNLYLVTNRNGIALERYDPVAEQVDRLKLQLGYSGRFTMASGSDGLYLAGFGGQTGRWFLSWNTLAAADWRKVEDVEIGGPASRAAQ